MGLAEGTHFHWLDDDIIHWELAEKETEEAILGHLSREIPPITPPPLCDIPRVVVS